MDAGFVRSVHSLLPSFIPSKTTASAGAGDGLSLRCDYSSASIVNEQRQTKLHFTLPRYSPVVSRWLSITSPAATHLPYLVDVVGLPDSLCQFDDACLALAAAPFQSYPSCAGHALSVTSTGPRTQHAYWRVCANNYCKVAGCRSHRPEPLVRLGRVNTN